MYHEKSLTVTGKSVIEGGGKAIITETRKLTGKLKNLKSKDFIKFQALIPQAKVYFLMKKFAFYSEKREDYRIRVSKLEIFVPNS